MQADLKTFLACRVHGMSAITAVTVQNSLGVTGFHELPPQVVADQIESVTTDIGVGAAKTGMLASAAIMAAVAEVVTRLSITPFVVDPVAASQHGDPLLRPDAFEALRDVIVPLASLITPNLGEVTLLTGIDVRTRADMDDAARALLDLGPQAVLVKGGHLPSGDAVDVLYDGTTWTEFAAPRHVTDHTHGSGDTLASSITAGLARGLPLVDAVREGKAFVTRAVAGSFPLGAGLGPVGHFWQIREWPHPNRHGLTLTSVSIGAPDPRALAPFYAALLGWPVVDEQAQWAQLQPPSGEPGPTINIEYEPDHVPPVWPTEPGQQQVQAHLDIRVEDLDDAQAWAVRVGARVHPVQPQDDVRVMLDPVGHPFCLFLG